MSDRKGEIYYEKLLVRAAGDGDLDKIVTLLDSGVLVDANEYNRHLFYSSRNYITPLQMAASNGKLKSLKYLIDKGANVNARDLFHVTALHLAAEGGYHKCLKTLLEARAKCSIPTKRSKGTCYARMQHLGGTTPLHLAAYNNHAKCIRELIEHGADFNAVDERGHTSLYIAARRGHTDSVLAHLKTTTGKEILSLPSTDTFDTPLHFAVRHSMVECVRELLNSGSAVNHLNFAGCSPLHLAVILKNEDKTVSMEILQMLVLNGYQVDVNQMDSMYRTPLHYVCFEEPEPAKRRPEMAKFLISLGADVNIRKRFVSFIEHELTYPSEEFDILKYIVRSMLHLPDLRSLQRHHRWYLFSHRQLFRNHHPLPYPPAYLDDDIQIAYENADNRVYWQPVQTSPNINIKAKWYEAIASNPRTLQHYCRYSIRTSLSNLKDINVLPLPNRVKSYLYLEFGD